MARVLFGWELAGDHGQAELLAELARGLVADGADIVVAGADLVQTRLAFDGIPARVLQAPRWPQHRHVGSELGQAGYLDVLATIGFADPAKISAVAEAWSGLIDLVQPNLIVADHGPGLLAATYKRGIPVAAVGSAFSMPPLNGDRLPPLRADRGPIVPEGRMLSAASEALSRRGAATPGRLVELFQTEDRFVFGVPELDPYRAFRREPLYAPPSGLPAFVAPPISPQLLVYLGAETPDLAKLAALLGDDEVAVTAYFRGDAGFIPDFLTRRGHMVHASLPRLAELLPKVSHVLHAGEMFLAASALAAGRPQLVLPVDEETRLNLSMLERLGVARRMPMGGDAELLRRALRAFLEDHALAAEARHWGKVIADRPADGTGAVVAALRRRLG